MIGLTHISYSRLREFAKSPRHLANYLSGGKEVTDPMKVGMALDCLISDLLRKPLFNDEFAVAPEADGRTKAGKELLAAFQETAAGKTVISAKQYEGCVQKFDALLANKVAAPLLKEAGEVQKLIEFDAFGYKHIGYADKATPKSIFDLKKVASADPRKLKYSIFDSMWHVQSAIYCYGLGITDYKIVAVDDQLNITVIQLSPETIEKGLQTWQYLVEKLDECILLEKMQASYEFWAADNGIYTV